MGILHNKKKRKSYNFINFCIQIIENKFFVQLTKSKRNLFKRCNSNEEEDGAFCSYITYLIPVSEHFINHKIVELQKCMRNNIPIPS